MFAFEHEFAFELEFDPNLKRMGCVPDLKNAISGTKITEFGPNLKRMGCFPDLKNAIAGTKTTPR